MPYDMEYSGRHGAIKAARLIVFDVRTGAGGKRMHGTGPSELR